MSTSARWISIIAITVLSHAGTVPAQDGFKSLMGSARGEARDLLREYLAQGRTTAGMKAFADALTRNPGNDNLRFGHGIMQFMRAVEGLGQSWYKYGLRPPRDLVRNMPFIRLPVPYNPNPEVINNAAARKVLEDFLAGLTQAEATLAAVKDQTVFLPLPLGAAKLDLNGDGIVSDDETLSKIFVAVQRGGREPAPDPQGDQAASEFTINLDAGDVQWLRGYCNLLSAFAEFYLAYDDSKLFAVSAHLFFPKTDPALPFLSTIDVGRGRGWDMDIMLDGIALVHSINFPLKDAGRMKKALKHLKQVTVCSRESWRLYMKETDDSREWIPNPRQKGVIPGATVTAEMVTGWLAFLDEIDAILSGRKLAPFWRGQGWGINVAEVFEKPRDFDLVLWVQGTGVAPYLEKGQATDPQFWNQLMRSFNGRFFGYALWFN